MKKPNLSPDAKNVLLVLAWSASLTLAAVAIWKSGLFHRPFGVRDAPMAARFLDKFVK